MDMNDLERRYDGPIPQRLKDIVIYGSRLKADIVELEDLVEFYTRQVTFHRRCANTWRACAGTVDERRDHRLEMARNNDTYAAEALAVLQRLTHQLKALHDKDMPKNTERRGRLTSELQCLSCGRDYKPDADDSDIFPGALCPVDDCPGVGE